MNIYAQPQPEPLNLNCQNYIYIIHTG